jgi:hypothetical protein
MHCEAPMKTEKVLTDERIEAILTELLWTDIPWNEIELVKTLLLKHQERSNKAESPSV